MTRVNIIDPENALHEILLDSLADYLIALFLMPEDEDNNDYSDMPDLIKLCSCGRYNICRCDNDYSCAIICICSRTCARSQDNI